MSVSLGGMDLASPSRVFSYERETWEKMWLNSRASRVNEHMAEARAVVMDLILAGQGEVAQAVWGSFVDQWALMLASPAEQAAAIRASTPRRTA